MVRKVTTASFDEIVRTSELPVFIDFWGPRCQPCLALSPAFEALAEEYGDQGLFLKAEASQNRMLCVVLRVFGLPTFVAFSKGEEMSRLTGDIGTEQLKSWVGGIVGGKVARERR